MLEKYCSFIFILNGIQAPNFQNSHNLQFKWWSCPCSFFKVLLGAIFALLDRIQQRQETNGERGGRTCKKIKL